VVALTKLLTNTYIKHKRERTVTTHDTKSVVAGHDMRTYELILNVKTKDVALDLQKRIHNIVIIDKVDFELSHQIENQGFKIVQVDANGLDGTADEIIQEERLFNVYVFGLPRSGTSMHTKIVELLGVTMHYTTENDENKLAHDERYLEKFGEDYHPNATGFFEIGKDAQGEYKKIREGNYGGCKMIIPVRGHRWELCKETPSKVIMTWRDPEEIRQSQMGFYSKASDIGMLRTALVAQQMELEQSGIPHIISHMNKMIADPCKQIAIIKEFINSPNSIDEAVKFVDPKQYRFRKSELVEGL